MQYPEQVVQGIKSSKDSENVVEHNVGLALETLMQVQQSTVNARQPLYQDIQQSGQLSNDRNTQY
jgi:hypothetical protein